MSRSIIVKVGETQKLLKDRDTCPLTCCDSIEDLVSCNKANLSNVGGSGTVRFNNEDGGLVVWLTLDKVKSFLSDEGKSIILIRSKGGKITANAYYGKDCNIDFNPKSEVFDLNDVDSHVKALKDFISSWVHNKGELGAMLIIVDRFDVFENIKGDESLKGVYLLCSE